MSAYSDFMDKTIADCRESDFAETELRMRQAWNAAIAAAAKVCGEHVEHWRRLQEENERLGHHDTANAFRIQANVAESRASAIAALRDDPTES